MPITTVYSNKLPCFFFIGTYKILLGQGQKKNNRFASNKKEQPHRICKIVLCLGHCPVPNLKGSAWGLNPYINKNQLLISLPW